MCSKCILAGCAARPSLPEIAPASSGCNHFYVSVNLGMILYLCIQYRFTLLRSIKLFTIYVSNFSIIRQYQYLFKTTMVLICIICITLPDLEMMTFRSSFSNPVNNIFMFTENYNVARDYLNCDNICLNYSILFKIYQYTTTKNLLSVAKN